MKANTIAMVDNTSKSASLDMSASFTTSPVPLDQLYGFAIQAVFAGSSPTGTFKLQVSSDNINARTSAGVTNTPANWTDLANSAQAISANGNFMWNVNAVNYNWVRLVYTRTSGTGTCTANLAAKGV